MLRTSLTGNLDKGAAAPINVINVLAVDMSVDLPSKSVVCCSSFDCMIVLKWVQLRLRLSFK